MAKSRAWIFARLLIFNIMAVSPIFASNSVNYPFNATISDTILSTCYRVRPEGYAPGCFDAQFSYLGKDPDMCSFTGIKIGIWLDRLHSIDDETESFSISGSVAFTWDVKCVGFQFPNADSIRYADETLFWKPHIYHRNSVNDYGMTASTTSRFCIQSPSVPDTTVEFYWMRLGFFQSSANFDYSLFPFDEQDLEIQFLVRENRKACAFTQFYQNSVDNMFVPDGLQWKIVNYSFSVSLLDVQLQLRSVATVSFRVKRRPEHYIYNFMIPCLLLTSVQVFAMLIPTEAPDRPCFSVTLLLALTVLESSIVDKIPPKPQRLFLTNYTDLSVILSWCCTVYSLFGCLIAESPFSREWCEREFVLWNRSGKVSSTSNDYLKELTVAEIAIKDKEKDGEEKKKRPGSPGKDKQNDFPRVMTLRNGRLMDAIAFTAAMTFLASINFYAVGVADDAEFFDQ